jgi:hypothetical protein
LLAAVDDAMPKDAVLYLEGGSIAPEIAAFLAARPALEPREVARGTIWPTARTFHVPLTALPEVRALAERHAAPEVCDHLVVYRGDEWLLWAHDAGYGYVQLARSLPVETVERFRLALGDALSQREWPSSRT